MRYLLVWHAHEDELRARTPEWHEEVMEFLAGFDGRLAASSELEWSEVLAEESQAVVVGPDRVVSDGYYNVSGKPASRLWSVRVATHARAVELASELAGELDTWIEVRECLEGAQRP